jgi:hypothetical protein
MVKDEKGVMARQNPEGSGSARKNKSVASSVGLRSGLRQSGRPLRGGFLGTAEAVPLSKTDRLRANAHSCGKAAGMGPPLGPVVEKGLTVSVSLTVSGSFASLRMTAGTHNGNYKDKSEIQGSFASLRMTARTNNSKNRQQQEQ